MLAPDLRGFGGSQVAPGVVTMRDYAADVEDLLDDLTRTTEETGALIVIARYR